MKKEMSLKKQMGLLTATMLVAGNMIGSGIFMLPATLANTSGTGATILAWILTGIGSIFLALSYANLGSKITKTGGPYEYPKEAFGDFIGFLNAWLYWNASWIGNAAIITSVASYTGALIPAISGNAFLSFIYTSSILWIFTIINIMGVKKASAIQTAITIFKIALFFVFIVITAYYFNPEFLKPAFPQGRGINTLPAAMACTLWAFTGFESASVAAGEIKNPEKNIKLSTIFGILIAIVVYILISIGAMGAIPQEELAKSSAPIIEIFSRFLGSGITKFILVASIISVIGTTTGWIFATARVSYAAGQGGIFPPIFAKVHPKYNTPHASLIIGSILTNILLLMNYTKSMLSAFNFIMLLATVAYLPVYAFAAAAEIKLMIRENKAMDLKTIIKKCIIPCLGLIYVFWAMAGSGMEVCLYGLLLAVMGIPFYIYVQKKKRVKESVNSVITDC
ncbi:APC family permease [Haloimpatiens lingqiaonensis]|uniref:APC family permease n=1 Tax=Haloimpatiens lingqiaonensis TaxID=1380675 RepID=UPI0010FE582F|nr:amino acid permease [Haloimpatiens lingqiaonensis]